MTSKKSASKKVKVEKIKLASNGKSWHYPAITILAFAVIGTIFIVNSNAAPNDLPVNSDDIVAAYVDSKPTVISREGDSDTIKYESYTSSYMVLQDGTLLCDNGNANGDITTGRVNHNVVRQLHREIKGLKLDTLPTDITQAGETAHVSTFEGFILGSKDSAKAVAVSKGASKPDKLAKMKEKILKACEKAINKENRQKARKYNIPKVNSSSQKVSDSIFASLFPKAYAAPPVASAIIDIAAANYQFNQINALRASRGIHGLVRHGCLDISAQGWSKKMAEGGGFYHNPNLGNEILWNCSPARWRWIAENIAYGGNTQIIYNAFVASPPHLSNMLSTSPNYIGVGAYWGATNGTLYVTHVFARL